MSHLSATYKTANVSDTTLVDTTKASTSSKPGTFRSFLVNYQHLTNPGLETSYKPTLKERIQRKLSGSVDPKKKPADPYKSWEARSGQ